MPCLPNHHGSANSIAEAYPEDGRKEEPQVGPAAFVSGWFPSERSEEESARTDDPGTQSAT